jgi:hypothetical protein
VEHVAPDQNGQGDLGSDEQSLQGRNLPLQLSGVERAREGDEAGHRGGVDHGRGQQDREAQAQIQPARSRDGDEIDQGNAKGPGDDRRVVQLLGTVAEIDRQDQSRRCDDR